MRLLLIRISAFLLNRTPFLDAITLLFLAGELSQNKGRMTLHVYEIYAYATVAALVGAFLGFSTQKLRSTCAKVYCVVLLYTCFGMYSRKALHPADHVSARCVIGCIGSIAAFLYYASLIDRSESAKLTQQQSAAASQDTKATQAKSATESESESESEKQQSDSQSEETRKSENGPQTPAAPKPEPSPGESVVYKLSNIFLVIYCILNAYAYFNIAEQRQAVTYHVVVFSGSLESPLKEAVNQLPTVLSVAYLCVAFYLGNDRKPRECATALLLLTICAKCAVELDIPYFHRRMGLPFWLHFRTLVDHGIVFVSLLLRRRYG